MQKELLQYTEERQLGLTVVNPSFWFAVSIQKKNCCMILVNVQPTPPSYNLKISVSVQRRMIIYHCQNVQRNNIKRNFFL